MILADTSIWLDHFRKRDAELYRQLQRNNISIHPFLVNELVLGDLPSRGIGFVDAHLIASTLITPHTVLWSRDKRLREVAATLGINANVS